MGSAIILTLGEKRSLQEVTSNILRGCKYVNYSRLMGSTDNFVVCVPQAQEALVTN